MHFNSENFNFLILVEYKLLVFKILNIPPQANQGGGQDFIKGGRPPGPTLATALIKYDNLYTLKMNHWFIKKMGLLHLLDETYAQVTLKFLDRLENILPKF